MEVFKILSKKTKKGQPNLNLQMEYLLKKIHEKKIRLLFQKKKVRLNRPHWTFMNEFPLPS